MKYPNGVKPGQWWNAPAGQLFVAYYLCLRVCYEMPAGEAHRTARANWAKYPEFFGNPIGTIREAICTHSASRG